MLADMFLEKDLQPLSAFPQRKPAQRPAIIFKQIERNKNCGRFYRKFINTTGGGMQSLKQSIERERLAGRDNDFSIQNELLRIEFSNLHNKLRKISGQRLARLGSKLDGFSIPKYETSEAIPFRLVLPVGTRRNICDGQRLHGSKRFWNLEGHKSIIYRDSMLREGRGQTEGKPFTLYPSSKLQHSKFRKPSLIYAFVMSRSSTSCELKSRAQRRALPIVGWLGG